MPDKRKIELSILIAVIISLFIHVIIAAIYFSYSPNRLDYSFQKENSEKGIGGQHFIIVNINEDNKKEYTDKTFLSDKDSTAKGHITESKGDTWLNNSREFMIKGSNKKQKNSAKSSLPIQSKLDMKAAFPLTVEGATIFIASPQESEFFEAGDSEWTSIPDIKGLNKENSLYYSSRGSFSFNTAKFKDAAYFHKLQNKVASNFFPPVFSNSTFMAYGGTIKFRMVQSQEVVLYFKMNRAGDVLDVKIIDSMGNEPLNTACVDSIRLSKNFGEVPEDIKGEEIFLPFIFSFYFQ